jgi:ABC-2 type transport system permease protein
MLRTKTRWSFVLRSGKYWSIFRTQLINTMAYPVDFLARSFMIVLFMWIFAQLWGTTFETSGANSISGLTLRDTMWYLMIAETIVLSQPLISTSISESVKDGSIAYFLSKPYNFIFYQMSVNFGDSLLLLATNALAGGAVVWAMVGPPPDIGGWAMTLFTIFLALMINFCMNAMIGMLAFVTEEINAFQWIYTKFVLILGGVLIPLDFFPPWLKSISLVMPFAHMTYGPARLFVEPEVSRFVELVSLQLIWLAILGISLSLMFRKATSWLVINGG